jgi:hypothetical protein
VRLGHKANKVHLVLQAQLVHRVPLGRRVQLVLKVAPELLEPRGPLDRRGLKVRRE